MNPPVPPNEAERLAALQQYNLLDTPPEEVFDDLTRLAAHLCDAPIALISLVDANRQWFKAKVGLTRSETSRDISFCGHAILQPDELFIVPDALADERFADNPLVTSEPNIRFYAGAPLVTHDGYALGMLCVIDHIPRQLTGEQLAALQALRRAVINEIQLRDNLDKHKQIEQELQDHIRQLNLAHEQALIYAKALNEEIAERRQAEQALEEERALLTRRVAARTTELSAANAELARTAHAKDEFLASMSHELRTPLHAILGLTEALQEQTRGPLNERQLKSLRTIEESGRHLLALINDILDISKIEAGKLELQLDRVSVEAVCQTSLLFIRETAAKKKIQVLFTLDSTVSNIHADARRLKQLLVNLLTNAVKFTPENGQVSLEVRSEPAQEALHFIVSDTGIGIAQSDLARLFQPFVQLDSSLSRQHEGTGLGLALVSRLAELHGGGIVVESQAGQGSRFTVSLPWSNAVRPSESIEPAGILPFHQAVVIEDSPIIGVQLTQYLSQLDIQATLHPQQEGAMDKVVEVQPDLILLDLQMPGRSGWEVLSQLKANPHTTNIPLVVISVADEHWRGLALGAAEYLIKPISRQQLHQSLSHIDRRGPEISSLPPSLPPPELPLILLAEDNEANIELLANYLEDEGYRLATARNGVEAIERANEEPPALILMDIQMPGMDGLTAIRRIRADSRLAHIPIIALTALAMPDDHENCLAAGANDYLSKPVGLKKLNTTIKSYLEAAKVQESSRAHHEE